MKGGHGIFGVRNHLGACCGRDGETGTNESVQVMTRKKWEGKKVFHFATSLSPSVEA